MNILKGKYWDEGVTLVDGCTPCSPGCDNCRALAMVKRFKPEQQNQVIFCLGRLNRFTKKKSTVFSIWNDLFHKDIKNEAIGKVFTKMYCFDQHTYLVLTKRPAKMSKFIDHRRLVLYAGYNLIPDNIWLGLTICNQQEADEKLPVFLQIPGNKFLSIEPMLEKISFRWMKGISREHSTGHLDILKDVSVVILGAETGTKARPMNPDWARSIRDECVEAGVPFFLKQLDKNHNRILDGRSHDDLPWMVK